MPRNLLSVSIPVLLVAMAACSREPAQAQPAPETAAADAPVSSSAEAAPSAEAASGTADTTADAPSSTGESTAGSGDASQAQGHWSYTSDDAGQKASIAADGGGRLVFASGDTLGRDAYLELPQEVECATGCEVQVQRDGGQAQAIPASRPETPKVILNLDEPRELWRSLSGVNTLTVTYPARAGQASLQFDVAGTDLSRLDGWAD